MAKRKTKEVVERCEVYTVFNFPMALEAPYTRSEGDSEEVVHPPYLVLPNAPRLSIDGSKGIVTGVYGEAPDCLHLTQEEAEALMATAEWTAPEEV